MSAVPTSALSQNNYNNLESATASAVAEARAKEDIAAAYKNYKLMTYPNTPWLNTPQIIRGVAWSKGWLWDCNIPDAPSPFDDWFPATEFHEDLFSPGQPKKVMVGTQSFELPGDRECTSVTLGFPDNDQMVLQKWLENWVNDVLYRADGTVATLTEGTKCINFARLDSQRNQIQLRQFWVYPKQKIEVKFGSDDQSAFVTLELNCEIVSLYVIDFAESLLGNTPSPYGSLF